MKELKNYTDFCNFITNILPISVITAEKGTVRFFINTKDVGFFTNTGEWRSLDDENYLFGCIHSNVWSNVFNFNKEVKNIDSLFNNEKNIQYVYKDPTVYLENIIEVLFYTTKITNIIFDNNILYLFNEDECVGKFFLYKENLKFNNQNRITISRDKFNFKDKIKIINGGYSDNTRIIEIN